MGRIDANFHRLQPITFPQTLEGEDVAVGGGKAVECREGRRIAGSHIGEDDAVPLFDRIGRRC